MQVNSTMRHAFDNILMKNISKNAQKGKNRVLDRVIDSLNRKVGLVRSDKWDAHLSHKTATLLKAKEGWTFERQPFTRYDAMVSE